MPAHRFGPFNTRSRHLAPNATVHPRHFQKTASPKKIPHLASRQPALGSPAKIRTATRSSGRERARALPSRSGEASIPPASCCATCSVQNFPKTALASAISFSHENCFARASLSSFSGALTKLSSCSRMGAYAAINALSTSRKLGNCGVSAFGGFGESLTRGDLLNLLCVFGQGSVFRPGPVYSGLFRESCYLSIFGKNALRQSGCSLDNIFRAAGAVNR